MRERGVTMRTYLAVQVMAITGCNQFEAIEAVSSTALAHPEWDLDKRMSWQEWAEELDRQSRDEQ